MARPRLLDLFCGEGGAGEGYRRAGFDVTGVDLRPMPRNPHHFIQADALEYLAAHGHEFDAIHASPPCQSYSNITPAGVSHPDLYETTRRAVAAFGVPWVVENVIGAPYGHGVMLCGSMFGLERGGEWLRRHRNFETSWLIFQPQCKHPEGIRSINITGHSFITTVKDCGKHSRQGPFSLACDLMGIHWMTRKGLVQAIPPGFHRVHRP